MQPPVSFLAGTESFPPLATVLVEGADSAGFLNGQFTCDVPALADGHWQWGGYCSPKGRLLATFRIGRLGESWLIQLPASLATDFVTRLRRFVLRAKVTIGGMGTRCSTGRTVSPSPAGTLQRIGDSYIWGLGEGWAALVVPETAGSPARAGREWIVDIALGSPWVLPATVESFVPQMVDLDRMGGVSFTKGCYPGQEIVARARYLGEVKRRLMRLALADGPTPAPGDAVTGAEERPAGTVLLAERDGAVASVLAVVDLDASRTQSLRVGATPVVRVDPVVQDA